MSDVPKSTVDRPQIETCAVIVHWGDALPTVEAARQRLGSSLFSRVVVVANDMKPLPVELERTSVCWEIPPRNLGFAGGCQFAADRHPSRTYALFNPDVQIDDPALARCLKALDDPHVGIVGPVLLFPSGGLQSGCGSLTRVLKRPRCNVRPTAGLAECEWVTGAALVCRGALLQGLRMDASYFLDKEDVDFCVRARKAGWRVVVDPRATGVHPGRSTLRRAMPLYYGARNSIWFARRHGGLIRALLVTVELGATLPRLVVGDTVKRRESYGRAFLHGLIDGWRPLPMTQEPLPGEPLARRWVKWPE